MTFPFPRGRWSRSLRARLQRSAIGAGLSLLRGSGTGSRARLGVDLVRWGWGNVGFAADRGYLLEVARLAQEGEGPVLECGSGASTLVLEAVAGSRGRDVYSLEHDPRWRSRVSAVLTDRDGGAVRLLHAPLREYDDFTWYTVPADLPTWFALVICDGPPSTTPGGRFGLLPVMRSRLGEGTIILLDDVEREAEQETMRRWRERARLNSTVASTGRGCMATLVLREDPEGDRP